VELNTMGTIPGWVVGWANPAAQRSVAGKSRWIRARNAFRDCLTSWSTHRRARWIPSCIWTTNLTCFLDPVTYWFYRSQW